VPEMGRMQDAGEIMDRLLLKMHLFGVNLPKLSLSRYEEELVCPDFGFREAVTENVTLHYHFDEGSVANGINS
jgi:hypothetical protein